MAVALNHTIVNVRDKHEAATFLTELLDLPAYTTYGPFAVVELSNGVSLDWKRVAVLPDYVYFRHDIHIAKGVGCVECHGRIDKMALTERAIPLTMQFCIDCHRDPAPRLRPADQVTNMNWQPSGDRDALGRGLGRHVDHAGFAALP